MQQNIYLTKEHEEVDHMIATLMMSNWKKRTTPLKSE
jgi:hypothetical protein